MRKEIEDGSFRSLFFVEYTYGDSNWKDKSMEHNGKGISYKYNDSGIRTEKTVKGVTINRVLSFRGAKRD